MPQEVRDRIYDLIRFDILNERLNKWFEKPVTDFDGLKLTCHQIYQETDDRLFLFCKSQKRVSDLLHLPSSHIVLSQARSLSLEIPFDQISTLYTGLASTLDTIQLSLQELRLSFTGEDKHGKSVCLQGCGKIGHSTGHFRTDELLPTGQYIQEQLDLLRQLTILRNLRVLAIKNANIPILMSMVITNKPHLQALQVISDPRSTFHQYEMLPDASSLLKGLLLNSQTDLPPVKVLHIGQYSSLSSHVITVKLMPTLEHLTYVVPDEKLASSAIRCIRDSETARVISMIPLKGRNLKVLRLCIGGIFSDDSIKMGHIMGALRYDLPATRLESLEIHLWNDSPFFKKELIGCLPPTLKRLYLSDHVISVNDLVVQVYEKFLNLEPTDIEFANGISSAADSIPESPFEGWLPSDHHGIIGELENRRDRINLTGQLGFVAFEYYDSRHHRKKPSHIDSNRTKLLRMNGKLLDREHNLHLARPHSSEYSEATLKVARSLDISTLETDSYSEHMMIACGLHAMTELQHKNDRIHEIISDLEKCGLTDDHWYFGNENAASEVFAAEPVAKIEDQQPRSFPMIDKVGKSDKCQWMAPEYDVPPVGTFPAPPMPELERYC